VPLDECFLERVVESGHGERAVRMERWKEVLRRGDAPRNFRANTRSDDAMKPFHHLHDTSVRGTLDRPGWAAVLREPKWNKVYSFQSQQRFRMRRLGER
jgi:hypothetical protein